MTATTAPRSRGSLFASLVRALGIASLAVWIGGCSTPMNVRDDAVYQSYGSAANRPANKPVRSISSFSDSLMCMDRLFREAQVPTTLITSKWIPDYSNRVPVATKEMIVTALSQMSRTSNAFRYVDYEVDIARQDTVQNLTAILLGINQMQLQRPALYVSGGVAFVDQNVLNNRFNVGTSASRLETGYSQNKNATIIGLELHLGDFRTRTLIPGLDSANEVVIGTGGQGLDLAGRISTYGWNFNVGRDYTQGSGAAIRTLVELAMIELAGKWARVPYWQCLTLDQAHPDFQRQLRDWYDEGDVGIRHGLIRQSLISHGYLAPDKANVPLNDPDFRAALARFQADQGMVVTGSIDFPTYERALRSFVGLGEDGKLVRIGWTPTTATPILASTVEPSSTGKGIQVYGSAAPAPLKLELRIENPKPDKSVFESGEQIFASATVSRASYLYCYFAESLGNVLRLLPNPSRPTSAVPANQMVRIPDWMAPNPGFVLDAGVPGTETLTCFASVEDPASRLPAPLVEPGLQPLPGFNGMHSIREAFHKAFDGRGYVEQTLQWEVRPRRAQAADASPQPKS